MSKISVKLYSCILVCLCIFSLMSCLKDAECHFSYQLRVKINASRGAVDSVFVYVFDAERLFKEKINVAVDTSATQVDVVLNHLPDGKYTFVVWGNLGSRQTVSEGGPGQLSLDEACVCLVENTDGTCQSPDNLFYGTITAERDKTVSQREEVTISRSISGIIIKAYNLLGYYNTEDKDFSFRLKGSLQEIPFIHNLTSGSCDLPFTGIEPVYGTNNKWKKEGELLESDMFLIFPSASGVKLSVDVYHKGELVNTHKINSLAVANKITEISLNYWNKEPDQWFNILDWSSIDQEENL